MRIVTSIALALLLAGCALPFGLKWPRMPWHKPRPKAEYCIVSLEPANSSGISVGNGAGVNTACGVSPSAGPQAVAAPSRSPAADPPKQVCANRTGVHNGFFFTFWKDGGDACMTLGERGGYSIRYDLSGRRNLVAGKGWKPGSADRTIGYRAESFDAGANSYLTLYGWSVDPLIEYYVVDGWGTAFKPPGHNSPVLGTVESDGGTYEIYRTTRVQQPSIRGRQTFDQYWSVRTQRRPLGQDSTITFANHVAAWDRLGMKLGTMDYQVMATEGFGSTGGSDLLVWER